MKIIKINHLGIAPKAPEQTKDFLGRLLNLNNTGSEVVEEQKVTVTFFETQSGRLEILEPSEISSPVQKFINERGGGIQHIALEVDDLEAWLEKLKKEGVQMVDSVPRKGAHNTKIAFVHPRATGGILIELVQEMGGK